ncbi:DUF262 domain-containing protein [Actinoplanes rectilineatus]|uniref:DUF262 domain-containing protein n=1 Tax=Actinoplanes rectilineatus TaxID=113571 RepID=UPI0005F289C2|nr:DUF262 domain-containing protein [Actinoplanes rectilineatus]
MTQTPFVLTVRETLSLLQAGRFRTPSFQRPYRWTTDQAISFVESIVAGLPVGLVLVTEAPAPGGAVRIGPVHLTVPPDPHAWWILDGSHRLGALAGALLPIGPHPLHLVIDLDTEAVSAESTSSAPWFLPLDHLVDDHTFTTWLDHEALTDAQSARAIDMRARILDYPLVLSRIDGLSPDNATAVFRLLNTSGIRLSGIDLARTERPEPSANRTPASIAARIAQAGFGSLPPSVISQFMDMADPEATLLQVLTWLRTEASVPHLAVWQQHLELLPALSRFFDRYPRPSPRARILLRRWLWRSMASPDPARTFRAISGRDSLDAAELLTGTAGRPPGSGILGNIGEQLALTVLAPRSPLTGEPYAVATLLEAYGTEVFQQFFDVPFFLPPDDGSVIHRLLRGVGKADVLASHAVDDAALTSIENHDVPGFRRHRKRLLELSLTKVSEGLAEWGSSDRPAISDLLLDDDSERGDNHARRE